MILLTGHCRSGKRLRLAAGHHRERDQIESSGFFVEWQLVREAGEGQ